MIKRGPKPGTELDKCVRAIMDNQFDYEDGSYEARANAVAVNLARLESVSVNLKPAQAKAPPPKKKVAQTKKPSVKKAEEEKKPAKKKLLKPVKSPAAKKPASSNKAAPRKTGGSGGHKIAKPKVVKEAINTRWLKMTPSAKSSYIQDKAGKGVKTADADEALSKIWSKLSTAQQEAHLKRHPSSRLKVVKGKKEVKPDAKDRAEKPKKETKAALSKKLQAGNQDTKPVAWWNKQTPEFQQKYMSKYPNSKFALHHKGVVRNLIGKVGGKIKDAAAKVGGDYHHGMEGLKAFRNGTKMTDEQKDGLKRTAVRVGAVIALSLVALSFFTPLGPAAMDLGEAWYRDLEGRGFMHGGDDDGDNKAEAGVNLEGHEGADASTPAQHKSNDNQLQWMVKDMTKFVMKQKDPAKFAASLKKDAGKDKK